MMEEKWHLPVRYQLDSAEKLAAAAQTQSQLAKKANSPFVRLSPAEAEFVRAKQTESHIVKIINQTEGSAQIVLRRRLAAALAAQGRFAEAVEVEPSPAKKEELRAYRDAGTSLCGCVNEGHWKNRPFRVTAHFVKREVFGQKPFIACSKCGMLAQVDLPGSLAKQRELRQQVREIAKQKGAEKDLSKFTSELLR